LLLSAVNQQLETLRLRRQIPSIMTDYNGSPGHDPH
jgi:hypothetical protein